jgi:LacI family transcriptional regulator, repressor for deo operon, udp, cdd, tsx, nupC, and nupG
LAVTLRDVAAHAGVSFRTVSNVVNDYAHVSPAMRAKVQASLDELGYRPNLLARSLRAGRTGILTLLVPEIAASYFGELAHEVVEQASGMGYTVMIDETAGDPARERALLDTAARSSWVDGVLLSSLGLTTKDLAGLRDDVPVVLLGERTAGSALDHVGFDNVAAARAATAHLVESGRTRIVAVGGTRKRRDATTRLRLRGYRQALTQAGLGEGQHVGTPDYGRASALRAVDELLDTSQAEALVCFSDELAAGAMRALHDHGLRVPEDVAVAGFDDTQAASFLAPSLTSVRQDRRQIARAALELVVSRMDDVTLQPRDVRIDWELVVRESSASS